MHQIVTICVVVLLGCTFAIAEKDVQPDAVDVQYHVWYHPEPNLSQVESRSITVPAQSKFINVMDVAAALNTKFRYEFIQYPFGKYITSIGGVKEDVPNKTHWMIYELSSAPSIEAPPLDSDLAPVGVDELDVTNGKNYLFWLKVVDY